MLTVSNNLIANSGSSSTILPDIELSSCSLAVNNGVKLDARTGPGNAGVPIIHLISRHPMQLNASSQYLANSGGVIETIHPRTESRHWHGRRVQSVAIRPGARVFRLVPALSDGYADAKLNAIRRST
jgi:hypothetical protein